MTFNSFYTVAGAKQSRRLGSSMTLIEYDKYYRLVFALVRSNSD